MGQVPTSFLPKTDILLLGLKLNNHSKNNAIISVKKVKMIVEFLGYTGIKIAAIGIEIGNVGILSCLLYLYLKSYRQIKIGFTLGLMLFASALLIKSISSIGLLIVDTDALVSSPVFVSGIIESIALLILLKITWDY
ncbi:MAG: hypothetical protein K8E24_001375 [Methanobacterium paludis]|nr:hypothetical protein [Methanobacterium paludis]